LLINKNLGPTQPSNSGMARWNDHSDTQGVLSGNSTGSRSKYATPAEQRRYNNLTRKEWQRKRIANSTPEELAAYNAKQALKHAKWKANMTPEEKAAFKAKEATAGKKWRANMTPEEKAAFKEKDKVSSAIKTAKIKAERMENDPEYATGVRNRERLANLTPAERKAADNTRHYENSAKRKAKMTPEELAADKEKERVRSAIKTAKIKAERMEKDPVYAAKVRERERRAKLTPAERKAEDKLKAIARKLI